MIKKNREPLSDSEKTFLAENYLYLTDESIADILGLASGQTVRKIRSKLGLLRDKRSTKEFVKEIPLVIWMQRELYDSPGFTNKVKFSI